MTSTHTPGPWTILDGRVVSSNGLFVANIGDGLDIDGEANAHLIAAAPDLLAALAKAMTALREAEAILGGEYGDSYGPLCEMMLVLTDEGEAAIAKATRKEGSK